MSSSGAPSFGNFSSIPPSAKSPKSPKGTIIENPLMKNAQFSYGGSASVSTQRTSTTLQAMPRSPLLTVTANRDNIRHQHELRTKPSQTPTFGPPPRTSLWNKAMPMQKKSFIANEVHAIQKEQRFGTQKLPSSVSTPAQVASPPLLKKGNKVDSYFQTSSNFSSESLVADHWVVAYGYTSSNEYEELLRILSSYGTIEKNEAGGNWLAVLYESRLSAEKALVSQTILLKNTLCGMARGTPSLLQSLSSGKGEIQRQSGLQNGNQSAGQSHSKSERVGQNRGNLDERDILMLANSGYESRKPYKPKSVCDKFFAWYFGWEEDHPHSD